MVGAFFSGEPSARRDTETLFRSRGRVFETAAVHTDGTRVSLG